MSGFRLLFDENMPRALQTGLARRCGNLHICRVGDTDGPPLGASDPEVLRFAEIHACLPVTRDRRTMPAHVADHAAAGGRTWGVLVLRRGTAIGAALDALELLVEASEPEEWRDVLAWLPFEE